MNKEMLAKLTGALVQLRPKAKVFRSDGEFIGESDDWWSVSGVTETGLELAALPVVLRLPYDHIHKVQSAPGWAPARWTVLVTSEVQIRGDRVLLEPLHPHPKVSTPGPGPISSYRVTHARVATQGEQSGRLKQMTEALKAEMESRGDPLGGDEIVGWRCRRGTRNELEQQRCGCGCGTVMVEGTMIFRDEHTGEEYEGAPRAKRGRAT